MRLKVSLDAACGLGRFAFSGSLLCREVFKYVRED